MKVFGKIIFVFMILFVGLLVYRTSSIKSNRIYYENEGVKHLIKGEKSKYIDTFVSSESFFAYSKTPIYDAVSVDEKFPFNLSIYHAKKSENEEVILFYFDDRNINDLSKKIDYENLVYDKDLYNKNNNLAVIRINIFMDENITPTTNYYSSSIEQRIPLAIISLDNKLSDKQFLYLQKRDSADNKPKLANASVITKIELLLEDYTEQNKNGKPIHTKIASFTLEDEVNDFETLENINGVMVSKGFDGSVSNFDKASLYERSNDSIYYHDDKVLKPYKKNVTRSMIIYVVIAVIITYLYYFLAPTINYFKKRRSV